MGSPVGTTNNPNHQANLKHFDSDRARAAAQKSAEVRRAKKQERAVAEAVARRDIDEWVSTYKREALGDACAAAAQKIAHDVLSGAVTDQRALVAALPVLFDIARLEAGQVTALTAHATITTDQQMTRLRELRAQALGAVPIDAPSAEVVN
jgi:hypothetical protein